MQLLDLTLERSVDNIALDEALLEEAEAEDGHEILRLWEPTRPIVVMGRSSAIEKEVKLDVCRERGVEVFRRCSGGQSVVTGPNCLMYAVMLDYRKRPQLRMLANVHQYVMLQMLRAIQSLAIQVKMQGTCDLTMDNRKFSGNALRCKRNWLIYHGTILCKSFDLELISDCLGTPQRQPDYRKDRSHGEFLTLLPTDPQQLRKAIISQWEADSARYDWPVDLTRQLSAEKYLTEAWTHKL